MCSPAKVVGWPMADTMTTDLVLSAFEMGLWRRDVMRDGLIHHSDKGSQGGFNRSSQHLDHGGADGATGGVDDDGDGTAGDAVAGAAANRRESERRFWLRIAEGLSSEDAAAACGVSPAVGNRWFRQGGGMPPMSLVPPSGRYLSFREREEIALLRAQEMTLREIAAQTNTKQRSTLTPPMRTLAPSSKLETANRASNEPGDLHPAGCRAWMRGCCWWAVIGWSG